MSDARKPTHTPGPWTLAEHGGRVLITASRVEWPTEKASVKAVRRFAKALAEPQQVIITAFAAAGMPLEEGLANARLIAAAPAMLDALGKVTIAAEEAANVLAAQYPGFAGIIRANVDVARAALSAASTGADDAG